ncbi:MAG: polyprenyl synthetase family protein [Gammaproteobacteria bacterium]|jgi:octaprenyl-diphosphate synthase|nr:polyprenyl synthetase family protein [Gammaproteobacteria bacterium]
MQAADLYKPVAADFKQVDQAIFHHLDSNVPLVEKIGEYIIHSGGKRLRPLLALLAARACGYKGDQHITLATVIEFIHTATLLHDDVVDTSNMRRGKPTANHKWGNPSSVLVGDFLYSRSFEMLVTIGNMPIMQTLSNATSIIAEGEVLQLLNAKNPDTSEADYLHVILGKTAMLFEAACKTGSQLAAATSEEIESMRLFGRHLGIAFQLIDDLMDYTGDADTMGKNVGDDLAEGKPTLPLIHAIATGNKDERNLIRKAIRKGDTDQLAQIQTIIERCGSLAYTRQMAELETEKAIIALGAIKESDYKQSLTNLCQLALARQN